MQRNPLSPKVQPGCSGLQQIPRAHGGSHCHSHQDLNCQCLDLFHLTLEIPKSGFHKEARLDLTSLASVQMVVVWNKSTGKFECQYETWVVGSLWLSQPDTLALPQGDQEITKLLIECETCSEPTCYAWTCQVAS